MELAIVSDTHIPSRAQRIPDAFRELVRGADRTIHAGDFDSSAALADVQALADALTAVSGNMDPSLGLPAVATLEVGGVEVAVTHGTGPPRGYEQRLADVGHEHGADVVVGGHTHDLLDTTRDGLRLLNPGSVTGASPASRATMLTATVDDGLDVTVHER